MADYTALRAEIDSNPAKYPASDTHAEVSATLQVEDVPVTGITLDSAQIYEAVDDDEFEVLTDAEKSRLRDIYSLSGPISVDNSRVRTVLRDIFKAVNGPLTRAALSALQPPNISRAVAIGLGAGRTRESDVMKARAL